jgi:hypothetical protein
MSDRSLQEPRQPVKDIQRELTIVVAWHIHTEFHFRSLCGPNDLR